MDIAVLEEFGLSKGEIKVYITLLQLDATKVGMIIEKSGMASSAVHNALNSLLEKGFISFIKKGKIKNYQTIPPKQILRFIEEKKKRFLDVLPHLESLQKLQQEKQEAEIFVGWRGVISMLDLFIENAKKGDEYLFFASHAPPHNEEIQKFFERYDFKRKEKGLIVKGLAPRELKPLFVKRVFLKMKYPSSPLPSNISIFKEKVILISWSEKPVGYLIISREIARIFRDFFYAAWNGC